MHFAFIAVFNKRSWSTKDKDRLRDRDLETVSDTGRIVRSSPFRRLQSKAQVFSMARSGTVRTRLTHSIEVSNYGELIAEMLANELILDGSLAPDLRFSFVKTVENACLLHDIGNPPFGHMGEYAIQQWFRRNKNALKKRWVGFNRMTGSVAKHHLDAYSNFDGNPHGFRIITRLQWLSDEFGMNLTCSLLGSYLKYLGEKPNNQKFHKKIGYFPTERDVVKLVWRKLGLLVGNDGLPSQRHPLVFLMEASDDIAFCLSDIEDALEKKVITEDEVISWMESAKSGDLLAEALKQAKEIEIKRPGSLAKYGRYHLFRLELSRYLVRCAVDAYKQNEEKILTGSMKESLLGTNAEATRLLELLKEFCSMKVYTSREAIDTELAGLRAITGLLDAYRPLMLLTTEEFRSLRKKDNKGLKKYPILSLLYSLLPAKHRLAYDWFCEPPNGLLEPIYRTQLVVDYVSGMTDGYVLKIFNMINGTQHFDIE
jgi:dGTPase